MGTENFFSDIAKDRKAREEASKDYIPEEWTSCPKDCAYCHDPFFGHSRPHLTQTRLSDGMSASDFVDQYRENN